MTMNIYKYVVRMPTTSTFTDVEMPSGARIIKAGMQQGDVCLWAIVNHNTRIVTRSFAVVGTGWDLADDFYDRHQHIDTLFDGPFVWHVFEDRATAPRGC